MGADLGSILNEPGLREVEQLVARGQQTLASIAAFPTYHNADFAVARICYAVCRACRPSIVLETGVGYGVTTAFILRALAANGVGELWSVDLPPLGRNADEQVGFLVPQDLRARWHLLRGSSRRVLPRLLQELGDLDVFVHDSLHTYEHMTWEFQSAWPRLRRGGALISDNVDFNRAFENFGATMAPATTFFAREESSPGPSPAIQYAAYGVILKGA
jgi:predicted O-methyltransferase YrrM